ncbi:MAG TPA: hypothetical protein VJN01_05745 [Xanthomonadales bacterium]|nr:hypothetical protein [Xanthomonadales bacterium]
MSATVQDEHEALVLRGRVWRIDVRGSSITAASSYSYGVVTGDKELVIFNRKYSSTTPIMSATLYETSFTGGATPQFANRRLSSTRPQPFTVAEGVVPGVLGSPIFSATIRAGVATGNAQASFSDPLDQVILKTNTSYVVQMVNLGAATADLDTSFDTCTTEPLLTFSDFGG